jgi:hypothetical protein
MKALVIGLGGAGVSIAGHLKAKLIDDKTYDPKTFRFIFLDTADDAKKSLQEMYPHIPELFNEFIDLGPCVPYQVWYSNESVRKWVSRPQDLSNQPLRDGAGAFRQQGRIALFRAEAIVRERLEGALGVLAGPHTEESDLPVVLLISSSCGGTGSSILLDVLALAACVYVQILKHDPVIFPIIVLPNFYISRQRDPLTIQKYQANAFAFFQELSDVSALQGLPLGVRCFVENFTISQGMNSPQRLYTVAFCVDTVTSEGRALNAPEPLYSTVAEGLRSFLQLGLDVLTNTIVNHMKELIHSPPPYRNVMGTLGVRVCRFPTELFYRYLQDRFVFEAFSALLGPSLDEIYPDPGEKRSYIERVFERLIGRFLFQAFCSPADSEAKECNLEINLTGQLTGRFQLSDSRFRTNGGLDKDKIRDRARVAQHVEEAKHLARNLEEELQSKLAGEAEPWARSRLLRKIEQELMKEVEESILRWGARATQELVNALDIRCSEIRYSPQPDGDLQERLEDIAKQQQALFNQIKTTLDAWPRRADGKDLQNLNGLLTQWLQAFANAFILRQQIELLDELSQGERGILDRWKRHLATFITVLQEFETTSRRAFFEELPKKFLETTNDATTIFLPNVAQFVQEGTWTPDHEFSKLYRKLVEQDPVDSNKALRFNPAFRGLAVEPKGFHKLLIDFKTAMRVQDLFLPALREGNVEKLRALAYQLAEQFGKYVLVMAKNNDDVRSQLEASLHDRFGALSHEERNKVFQRFGEDLVFCQSQVSMPHRLKIVEADGKMIKMFEDAHIFPSKQEGDVHVFSAPVGNRAIALTINYATTHEKIQPADAWDRYYRAAKNKSLLTPAFVDSRFEAAGGLYQAVRLKLEREIGEVGMVFAKAYLLAKLAETGSGKTFLSSLFLEDFVSEDRPRAPLIRDGELMRVPRVSTTKKDFVPFLVAEMAQAEIQWRNHAEFVINLLQHEEALRSLKAWIEVAESRFPGQENLLEDLREAANACNSALDSAKRGDPSRAHVYERLKRDVGAALREWERAILSRTSEPDQVSSGTGAPF